MVSYYLGISPFVASDTVTTYAICMSAFFDPLGPDDLGTSDIHPRTPIFVLSLSLSCLWCSLVLSGLVRHDLAWSWSRFVYLLYIHREVRSTWRSSYFIRDRFWVGEKRGGEKGWLVWVDPTARGRVSKRRVEVSGKLSREVSFSLR